MSIGKQWKRIVKKAVFGDTFVPKQVSIGLVEPQTEVAVWLRGIGAPRDVTYRHTTACTAPLTLCIALEEGETASAKECEGAALKFCERAGRKRVLGEVELNFHSTIHAPRFILFRIRESRNYCLPRHRYWAHYLRDAYSHWRREDPPDLKMTWLDFKTTAVTFIRPHPLCLVSVGDRAQGNIFPMNVMGHLGSGYFGFALREVRLAGPVVERARRIAISGLPTTHASLPFQLADNHKREYADWDRLSFETRPSPTFGIPVPVFATGVTEMEIEAVYKMGSHRFFIARIVSDEKYTDDTQLCIVHGFYQYWRMKAANVR